MIFPDKCPGKRCLPHSPANSSAPIGGVIGVRQFCFLHFSFGGRKKKKTCLAWQSFQLKGHTLTEHFITRRGLQTDFSQAAASSTLQVLLKHENHLQAEQLAAAGNQCKTTYSKSWTPDEQVDSQNAPEISSIISPMGLFWSLWEHWWIFLVKLIKYHNDW